MIYVTRNPRDAVVSYYHQFKAFDHYTGTFDEFADAFLEDECGYNTPFMHHVLQFWDKRHESNIIFITYEEMKMDLPDVIRR
jgi:hypothetical protein